jgi:hypothetical protein
MILRPEVFLAAGFSVVGALDSLIQLIFLKHFFVVVTASLYFRSGEA